MTTHSALGVVMAGGRSSRMGTDKGMLEFEGIPMARRIQRLLQGCGLDVVVSVNAEQVPDYGPLFGTEALVLDEGLGELRGPLVGLLSVHRLHPDVDLLAVACDMPLLGESVLHRLLHERGRAPADFVAFDSDGIQPLAALYTQDALRRIDRELRAGMLPPFCPRKLMSRSETTLLEPDGEAERLQFTNVNRPEELAAARAQLRSSSGT